MKLVSKWSDYSWWSQSQLVFTCLLKHSIWQVRQVGIFRIVWGHRSSCKIASNIFWKYWNQKRVCTLQNVLFNAVFYIVFSSKLCTLLAWVCGPWCWLVSDLSCRREILVSCEDHETVRLNQIWWNISGPPRPYNRDCLWSVTWFTWCADTNVLDLFMCWYVSSLNC